MLGCNDTVKILNGKHKGKTGYITEVHEHKRYGILKVSVRYRSGLGWQTSVYRVHSIELIKKA